MPDEGEQGEGDEQQNENENGETAPDEGEQGDSGFLTMDQVLVENKALANGNRLCEHMDWEVLVMRWI